MVIKATGLLIEYEEILLGKRAGYSNNYLGKNSPTKNAVDLLKYVFEELLRWDPETVRTMLNKDVIKKLNLAQPISMIEFPPELNPDKDYFYIAWYLYPETVHISKRDLVLNVYQEVLNGERKKFPKNFFLELDGELNKDICFQYAINQFLYISNLKDLYLFFADKRKSISFLKKYRLYDYYSAYYSDPLELLHDSLNADQKNEVFYNYAKFQKNLKETKEVMINEN